jgi:hypothetical protein
MQITFPELFLTLTICVSEAILAYLPGAKTNESRSTQIGSGCLFRLLLSTGGSAAEESGDFFVVT